MLKCERDLCQKQHYFINKPIKTKSDSFESTVLTTIKSSTIDYSSSVASDLTKRCPQLASVSAKCVHDDVRGFPLQLDLCIQTAKFLNNNHR